MRRRSVRAQTWSKIMRKISHRQRTRDRHRDPIGELPKRRPRGDIQNLEHLVDKWGIRRVIGMLETIAEDRAFGVGPHARPDAKWRDNLAVLASAHRHLKD